LSGLWKTWKTPGIKNMTWKTWKTWKTPGIFLFLPRKIFF